MAGSRLGAGTRFRGREAKRGTGERMTQACLFHIGQICAEPQENSAEQGRQELGRRWGLRAPQDAMLVPEWLSDLTHSEH